MVQNVLTSLMVVWLFLKKRDIVYAGPLAFLSISDRIESDKTVVY